MSTKGQKRTNYGVGRSVMTNGYVRIWAPGHPLVNKDGYVLEHRKVVYDAGIPVPEGHHVHHINGIKDDNRLENLEVLAEGAHHREHVQPGAVVTNQFGTFVVMTPEERAEVRRARCRDYYHRVRKHKGAS